MYTMIISYTLDYVTNIYSTYTKMEKFNIKNIDFHFKTQKHNDYYSISSAKNPVDIRSSYLYIARLL